jgi:uncharacterized protein (TIGR02145 family)
MKTLIFLLLFCFACTKIEYITEQAAATDSTNIGGKKPVDTIMKKPYTLHDIDGNVYDSVMLGTQTWMAENLKTTKYNNGLSIPNVTDNNTWKSLSTDAFCWYDNDISYKNIMGCLYNYYAVTDKLCPVGWRVPRDGDWKILEMLMGMSLTEADSLNWRGDGDAFILESSNFKALFAGFRSGWYGDFGDYGQGAYFWTGSEYDKTTAYCRSLEYPINKINRGPNAKSSGFSIRCIKN